MASAAWAGMDGQPKPSEDTVKRLRSAVNQFLIEGGDVGKARPDLILLVERDVTADLADLVAPALRDDLAYSGVAQAYADALKEKEGDEKARNFILYNLGKIHLYRSRYLPSGPLKRPVLDAAERTVKMFPENIRDWTVWELRGDIETEQEDTASAQAAYQRMLPGGGPRALSQYKMAVALQRGRNFTDARASYEAALRSDAASENGGGFLFHQITIGLAALYQQQGNDPQALQMLARAATAKQDKDKPYRFDLTVARRLLQRGYGKEVQAYAEAAVKNDPEDTNAQDLVEQAKAAPRRR
jgi:predicted Zn-dependent protease